jgi:PTS HPr component phosphorylation site.
MVKYVKLKITDIDNFCKNMNTLLHSDINIGDKNHILDGKSLLSLTTLDFTKSIRVEIISDDSYELNLFEKILERYK